MASDSDGPITVLRSTLFEETPWAVTDILPGGMNTPFTGIPSPSMHGADSVAMILEDFVIPGLNTPVVAPTELVFLNERNIEPLNLGGDLYDFFFTLNPAKRSLGTMTVIQTKDDDHGSAPDGIFMRETTLELLAVMVPRAKGQVVVTAATLPIASTVPIPFSFNPTPDMFVLEGKVGDSSVNWHVDKSESQRNFFIFDGLLQVPLGGQSLLDALGASASRGGTVMSLRAGGLARDENGLALQGHHVDSGPHGVPRYYDNMLIDEISGGIGLEYGAQSGELSVVVPDDLRLTAISISSATGIFQQSQGGAFEGPLDRQSATSLFKLRVGTSFGGISLGPLMPPGLTKEFLLLDISARALLSDGTPRSGLDLIYRDS
jgi:hypothetical protein